MQKILITKDCEYALGEIVEVSNNDAFSLIDAGYAKVYRGQDKMMRPEKTIKYKVK